MLRSSVCLVLIVILAMAAATPATIRAATIGGTPAATPGAAPAAIRIASQDVVDIADGVVLALSPDGQWLAVAVDDDDGSEICAYDTATLTEPICAGFSGASIGPDSATWSPDSTRLAFTENALVARHESDIWMFDRSAGTVTDLTDDDVDDDLLQGGLTVDLAPAWSPDGTEIAFARSVRTGEDASGEDIATTAIERIDAEGGDAEEIATVSDQFLAVPAGIRWRKDGTIHYSISLPEPDPGVGLWSVAEDGGDPEQIVSAAEAGLDEVILVDVSVGGMGLLLDRVTSRTYAVVDADTGDGEPIALPPSGDVIPSVLAACFSPDGGSLLMAVFDPAAGNELLLRDLETGEDQVVGTLDQALGQDDFRSGLAWGANGVVFGPSAGTTGVLLQLAGD